LSNIVYIYMSFYKFQQKVIKAMVNKTGIMPNNLVKYRTLRNLARKKSEK